jgi:hypothetical protein
VADRNDGARALLASVSGRLHERLAACAERSRIEFSGGLRLHSPCASATYRGIWPDDFLWPLAAVPSLADNETLARALSFITASVVDLPRVPDRIEPDGMPVMQPGALSAPHAWHMPLHLPAAWVRLLDVLHARGLEIPRIEEWARLIERSFAQVPFACGLAYVDPQRPGAGFGFHDPCAITGFELMSSLVLFRGLQRAARLFAHAAPPGVLRHWEGLAASIRENLSRLWSEKDGAYLAGSKDCRQVNAWANGLAYWLAGPAEKPRIVDWYRRHRDQLFRGGCTRQVAEPGGWQRQLVDIDVGTYTNGGYWATGTGFVLPALADQDAAFAAEIAAPLIDTLERTGDSEWIAADGAPGGARGFLAALSLPCLALRCILDGRSLLEAF